MSIFYFILKGKFRVFVSVISLQMSPHSLLASVVFDEKLAVNPLYLINDFSLLLSRFLTMTCICVNLFEFVLSIVN